DLQDGLLVKVIWESKRHDDTDHGRIPFELGETRGAEATPDISLAGAAAGYNVRETVLGVTAFRRRVYRYPAAAASCYFHPYRAESSPTSLSPTQRRG